AARGDQEEFIRLMGEARSQAEQVAGTTRGRIEGERAINRLLNSHAVGVKTLTDLQSEQKRQVDELLLAQEKINEARLEEEKIQKRISKESREHQTNIENALN